MSWARRKGIFQGESHQPELGRMHGSLKACGLLRVGCTEERGAGKRSKDCKCFVPDYVLCLTVDCQYLTSESIFLVLTLSASPFWTLASALNWSRSRMYTTRLVIHIACVADAVQVPLTALWAFPLCTLCPQCQRINVPYEQPSSSELLELVCKYPAFFNPQGVPWLWVPHGIKL